MSFHITRGEVLTVLGQAWHQEDYSKKQGGICKALYIVQNNFERFEDAFSTTALIMETAARHKAGNFDDIDLNKLMEHLK